VRPWLHRERPSVYRGPFVVSVWGGCVLTLTTYADYIPEQEAEKPLQEPVAVAPDTNVVKLFG
jgi:hypothetical protein